MWANLCRARGASRVSLERRFRDICRLRGLPLLAGKGLPAPDAQHQPSRVGAGSPVATPRGAWSGNKRCACMVEGGGGGLERKELERLERVGRFADQLINLLDRGEVLAATLALTFTPRLNVGAEEGSKFERCQTAR